MTTDIYLIVPDRTLDVGMPIEYDFTKKRGRVSVEDARRDASLYQRRMTLLGPTLEIIGHVLPSGEFIRASRPDTQDTRRVGMYQFWSKAPDHTSGRR